MAYASRQELARLEERVQALEELLTKKELNQVPVYSHPVIEEPRVVDLLLDSRYIAALVEAGYETLDQLESASDGELEAVPGIGPAIVKRIRGYG